MGIPSCKTPVYLLEKNENRLYIKREDLLPFSFGGNKARKAALFLQDIKKKNADYNKTLRKQARDVNTLKAQISALEGVKLFARLLFNSGKVPTTLSCYNGTGNGKRECGTSL